MTKTPLTIESKSGHFVLELREEYVTLRATDKLKRHIKEETANDPEVNDSGFGGRIARFVTGNVQALFDREISHPLADIINVSYDGNTLRFDYREKKRLDFESVREENHSVLEDFNEADARAFVTAFDAQRLA